MLFVMDVLYNENFNFGLKRSILEKIIPKIDKYKINMLNRLNKIRNYFAHCNNEIFKGVEIPAPETQGIIPDPRNTNEGIDFEILYEEFIKQESEVILLSA